MDVLDRAWVKKTLKGLGALKGANCTIKSTKEEADGIHVVFGWTGNDGTAETTEIIIPKGMAEFKDYTTGTDYETGDYIVDNGIMYKAEKDFTSSDINSDVTNGNMINYVGGGLVQSKEIDVPTASTTWSLQHNLITPWYKLTTTFIDSDDIITIGDVDVDNCTDNLLVVKFNKAISGKAIIKK